MNPDRRFTPIVGSLIYVWDKERERVLLIRRDARPDDDHFGKVNGLGGKVEVDEDIASSARRELLEEANLTATELGLRGTITFSDFGPKREQWLVFVFVVTEWQGTIPAANDEGGLEWAPLADVLAACGPGPEAERLPMWPGDKNFIPLVFDDDPRVFHGSMPYDADVPVSWNYERL